MEDEKVEIQPVAETPETPKAEVPKVEAPKIETPKIETPKVESEIRDPMAYIGKLKSVIGEREAELTATKTALSEKRNGAEMAMKNLLAENALRSNGISDSDILNALKKDIAENISLDDNFLPVESSYIEKAKLLAQKLTPVATKKTVVALPQANGKDEELSKDWRQRLRQRAKQL